MTSPAIAPPAPVRPDPRAGQYHRLAWAWPRPRWWRPLLGTGLAVAFYVAILVLAGVAAVVAMVATGADPLDALLALDMYEPAAFVGTMLSIILMLAVVLAGFRIAGARPVGLLSSVTGRLRWGWMARCALPALVLLALAIGIPAAFGAANGQLVVGPVGSPLLIVLILLLVPLQAAAEEYAFRGALMQTIGAWLRHPAWAILLPVPLFTFGHLYDPWGLASVAVFAVCAAWLTWRTGGLEAAIALHVVNNLAAMLAGAAGWADLNASEIGWEGAVLSAVVPLVYVAAIEGMWRRRPAPGGSRRAAPVPAAPPAPGAVPGEVPLGEQPAAAGQPASITGIDDSSRRV